MRQPDVVLIKHLAPPRVIGHSLQHHAVLFQHVPVPFLQPRAIEEAPALPLEALHLPHPPEEHLAALRIHGQHVAHDPHVPAGARRRGVGDVEVAIHAAFGCFELHPVEILACLADARDAEAARALLQFQKILLGAEGQREAFGMEVAAVHRVGEVVERVAVIHLPDRRTQEPGPVRVRQFGRKRQGRRFGRLVGRHEDEDRIAVFGDTVGAQRLAPLHRAIRHGGHLLHRARAVDHDTVVAAADVLAVDFAVAERRAAMRAEVLDTLNLPVGPAPHDEPLSQCDDAHGAVVADLHGLRDRIPLIADAFVHAGLDPGSHLC